MPSARQLQEQADERFYARQRTLAARKRRRDNNGRRPRPLPDAGALPHIPDDEMRRYLDDYVARLPG